VLAVSMDAGKSRRASGLGVERGGAMESKGGEVPALTVLEPLRSRSPAHVAGSRQWCHGHICGLSSQSRNIPAPFALSLGMSDPSSSPECRMSCLVTIAESTLIR